MGLHALNTRNTMSTYNQVTPTALGHSGSQSTNSRPSAVQQHQQQQQQQGGLPPSLTQWVQRSHEQAAERGFSSTQLARLQYELKLLMEKANNSGKLWENNWDKQHVPILRQGAILELLCNFEPSEKGQDQAKKNKNKTKNKNKNRNSKHVLEDSGEDHMSSMDRKRLRAERFERELNHKETFDGSNINSEEYKFNKNQPIRGTSQALEKGYLRLTSAPDPSKVRPAAILIQAFNQLMQKYKIGAKYTYICDQFKAIRQDLTVQLIENEFTVKVYEAHARIAIENNDLGEFNQCQSVLQKLYELQHITHSASRLEFMSYGILYYLFTKNFDSITAIKLKLSQRDRVDSYIAPALEIIKAKFSNNYHLLFYLYSRTKNTTRMLLECFITNERVRALSVICTAYKQISLEFLLNEFHFREENDCMEFIADKQIDKFIELKGESIILKAAEARSTVFESLQRVRKVDIKGQV